MGDAAAPTVTDQTHRIFGVLVTYRRPDELDRALDALWHHSPRFDHLVIVDNAPDERSAAIVERHRHRLGSFSYAAAPTNLGPAGGRSLGVREIMSRADDADWVVFLDDDDPLPATDVVQRLVATAERLRSNDPTSAGLGLRGGRLDRWTGRLLPVDALGTPRVDHLHGNRLPCYRVGALRRVGAFDARLFFGFEELDLGLRLRRAGFSLHADSALYASVRAAMGHQDPRPAPQIGLDPPSLRRYYGLRNLLVVLGRDGRYLQAFGWAMVAGIAKPTVWLVARPRLAWAHLCLNIAAIRDAIGGRLGPRTWDDRAMRIRR
jgi:glycosyltransferase involved in cell wall biosynthesis